MGHLKLFYLECWQDISVVTREADGAYASMCPYVPLQFNSHGIMHVLIQVAHFFEFTFLVHMCLRREQEMLAY